ncbi:MAG: glycerophosphodiester phosphodiesterase family protein [Actinomycetes bacterium]
MPVARCETQRDSPGPVVIAHRGANGHRPDHTLAGYELAARMGADFIEPDLVTTKDGVLVARHENEISRTTDVASRHRFVDRYTTKVVDGERCRGWFAEDFTLDELKSLRAVERMPELRPTNTLYDRRFHVPMLQEVLVLRARLGVELGRPLGVYHELKHPTYSAGLGVDVESRSRLCCPAQHVGRRHGPPRRQVLRVRPAATAAGASRTPRAPRALALEGRRPVRPALVREPVQLRRPHVSRRAGPRLDVRGRDRSREEPGDPATARRAARRPHHSRGRRPRRRP